MNLILLLNLDPKDSNLDFRSLLKHRDVRRKRDTEDGPEWGDLSAGS